MVHRTCFFKRYWVWSQEAHLNGQQLACATRVSCFSMGLSRNWRPMFCLLPCFLSLSAFSTYWVVKGPTKGGEVGRVCCQAVLCVQPLVCLDLNTVFCRLK